MSRTASAQDYLTMMLGPTAAFRPGQLEAIGQVTSARRRVLLVQRTGWGKSVVYFIATRMLRDAGAGPTLLISPLLALMRNQIMMAERVGVAATTINSTNPEDFEVIRDQLADDEIDLLLVSPERLNNERFRSDMLPLVVDRSGLLAVDEAHCVSDWGHDFRPDYRRIVRVLDLLPANVPVLGTTATANDRVVDDVQEQLGGEVVVMRGSLDRESLELSVIDLPSQPERMAWLAEHLPHLPGSGIVYTLTIADSIRVAGFLREQGIDAMAYSGETEHEERLMLEAALLGNQLKCLVATSALGMGFDKPDLGFVVHFQSPGSPIAYYQQIGRAGRALEHAPAVLLRGAEDRDIQDYFIRTAFPPQRQAEAVVALLEERAVPMSLSEILAEVNIRRSRLDAMLKILEVEGAIQREGGRYLRTLATWNYPTERVERVTAARRLEQAAMVTYGETEQCLMEFLRTQLDDPEAVRCGRCMNCRGERPSTTFAPALVTAAREFLRGSHLAIPPRRQWPVGVDRRGRVPTDLRCEEGRALSVYNDGGWGALVRVGKWDDGHYADELVEASAQLIIERWGIGDSLEWVTCVPSLTHPDLVPSFARRLAEQLGLPFEDVIVKTRETRPQKEMENSAQQYRNVQRAFAVNDPPYGAVLLVDDIVDSGWTLTVLGAALREAGVEAVYPFVLAKAVSE